MVSSSDERGEAARAQDMLKEHHRTRDGLESALRKLREAQRKASAMLQRRPMDSGGFKSPRNGIDPK